MTDTRLREARRAWAETGTAEAARRYLLALQRADAIPADADDEEPRAPLELRVQGEALPTKTGNRKELPPHELGLGGDGYDHVRVLVSYGRAVAVMWWRDMDSDEHEQRIAWDPDACYSQTSRTHLNRWLRGYGQPDNDPRAGAEEVSSAKLRQIVASAVARGLGL